VRDATGAVLPNVAITIAGDPLMGDRLASTGAGGTFRISALPPGDYTLSFRLQGFSAYTRGVSVALGATTSVDVALSVDASQEFLTVVARIGALDRQATTNLETFDSGRLADLPGARSMDSIFAAAQAVFTMQGESGDSTGAYGTRASNRPTIEGIVVNGINAGGLTIDYGSFEQASVLTGSHDVEWATPGVHIQLVAKSGGNQYRGTLYADYANRHWQSFNVDRDQIDRGAPSGGGLSATDANRLSKYRDLNTDVGGFIAKDKLWWYGSLRDQETSRRLVNFPAGLFRTALTNYSGKGTYRIAPGQTLVAYAHAARNHQPNGLDPFGPGGSGLAASSAINEDEHATADQHSSGRIWKAEWQAAVRDRLLFELRVGQFATGERWYPHSTSPRFEDIQTLAVRGGNRGWESRLRRDQLFGNVSYFTNRGMGSHLLKLGVESMRWLRDESWHSAYPRDVLHVLRNDVPAEVYLFHTPSKSTSGLWTYAAYAGDSWQPHRRVGVNLGVRFDGYRVFLPAQEHPAGSPTAQRFAAVDDLKSWHVVVPRAATALDLTGRGTTLAKVAFAQYRVAPGNSVGFNANPNSSEWWTRFEWTDLDGSGVWEAGEEGLRLGERGGTAAESLDPHLRLPVVNEVAGRLEREVVAGIALRTGVVWRHEQQHFTRQNASQPFDAFTVPVSLRDPGADGLPDTSDDGETLTAYDLAPASLGLPVANIVRNVPGSRSEHWSWEIGGERRLRGRWTFAGGFTFTWSADQASAYLGQSVRRNPYPLTPNDLINTGAGGRHEFTTWTAKAHGTYEAPWNVRVTPLIRHQSGQPFGRTFTERLRYGTVTILAEPVGTQRTDNVTLVDLHVEKGFRVAGGRHAAGFIDIFNAFNANPAQNVVWSSGPSYGRPIEIVPPRIARIGCKVAW
jgi:hypothetical protein